MKLANFRAALAGLAAVALASWAAPSYAFFTGNGDQPQHGNCFTCGLATGYLPPPGLYFEETVQFGAVSIRDGSNNKTGIGAHFATSVPIFTYVPNLKILGGQPALVIIPPVFITESIFEGATQIVQHYATLNPAFIAVESWVLGNGFAVSANITGAPFWGSRGVGDSFDSIQTGVAGSYLADGWNFTIWTELEFAIDSDSIGNTPGDYAYIEYTATKNLGYLTAGIIGSTNFQFTNDSGGGVGNHSTHEISVGPYIEKEFGAAALKLYWTHDVDCANIGCGDTFFLRVDSKLF